MRRQLPRLVLIVLLVAGWLTAGTSTPAQIRAGLVNLATQVTGRLPYANLTASTAASKLLGRGSASGSGDWQEIALGSNLSMSGTTLNASGGGTPAGSSGDLQYNNAGAFGGITPGAGVSTALTQAVNGSGGIVLGQVSNGSCNGRLTLTTAVPVTISDVTGATTIYFTPYLGNRCALYHSTAWATYAFSEVSAALGTLTSGKNYDVFGYDSSGNFTLKIGPAWSSDTARGTGAGTTELALQAGVYVNANDITSGPTAGEGRYLGTFRTTSTTTTEDSAANRFVWNYSNRVRRTMVAVKETADSWAYSTAAFRQANANTANQLNYVYGLNEDPVAADVHVPASGSASGQVVATGVGVDSTAVNSAQVLGYVAYTTVTLQTAHYSGYPGLGYHYLAWLEAGNGSGTQTWYGDAGRPTYLQSGILGTGYF